MKCVILKKMFVMSFIVTAMGVVGSGCATDISSNSYSDQNVGEVADTYGGVVVKVRSVKVGPDQLSKHHTGALTGGVAGGLIGSKVSGGGIGGTFATMGIAGAGAVGGAMTEKSLRTQQGFEITVRLKSGEFRTVVQGDDVEFKKGEKILLMIYIGGRSKVVKEDA